MIAVDSLVHNFLHRTGILDSYQLDHAYGPRCHAQNGCLGVIQDLANRIDCREFNPTLPAHFPRFIQYYIWAYCGQSGENICNGNKCKPGKPNPACVLHQQRLCAELPPKGRHSRLGPILISVNHPREETTMSTFEAHCDESIIGLDRRSRKSTGGSTHSKGPEV